MPPVPRPEKTAAIPSEMPPLQRRREADSEDDGDDEPRLFRRVRIKCRQRAKKTTYQRRVEISPLFETFALRCVCGARDDLRLLESETNFDLSPRALLIQCVNCKAWQHRSCVGAANGKTPPGGWLCGQCSKIVAMDNRDSLENTADVWKYFQSHQRPIPSWGNKVLASFARDGEIYERISLECVDFKPLRCVLNKYIDNYLILQ